jgi:hypothetical protein
VRAARRVRPSDSQTTERKILLQLRSAIEVIENDALSRGAENIDREAVGALFEREEDQDEMTEVQGIWDKTRPLLFKDDPSPTAQEVNEIIIRMRDMNFRFMRLATRRFHEMVCARWNTGAMKARRLGGSQPPVLERGRARSGRVQQTNDNVPR